VSAKQPQLKDGTPEVLAALDAARESEPPIHHDEHAGWCLYRHADIDHVLHDPSTFSNAVSSHLSVPNGMDPPAHARYRQPLEGFFTATEMEAFEPEARRIAADLIDVAVATRAPVEIMSAIAQPFAGRAQCAFLGWPDARAHWLVDWVARNVAATREQDRPRLQALAAELAAGIDEILAGRPRAEADSADGDRTSRLLASGPTGEGRPWTHAERVSILRNWTAGEIGTLSAAMGILVGHIADHPPLQSRLRNDPGRIPAAIEEILRADGPLMSNRRITTCPVTIAGRALPAGARVTLVWPAANRDPRAFRDPGVIAPGRDRHRSLLWGAGIHVCPGAPLARLELRVVLEELFRRTDWLLPLGDASRTRAAWPAAGPLRLPVRLQSSPSPN